MSTALRYEHDVHVAPLGVRLWDVATGRHVAEGLEVTARRHGRPAVPAVRTPSGTFAFPHLPGVPLDAPLPGSPPGSPPQWPGFTVTVTDPRGRFLAVAADTAVPVGLLSYAGPQPAGWPTPPEGMLPLFSAPARPAPPAMAVVRAHLALPSGAPAAHAALEVRVAGGPAFVGIADERGVVVVFLPPPEPGGADASPPEPVGAATWPVEARPFLPPAGAGSPPAVDAPPALHDLLDQAPAHFALSPPAGALRDVLHAGAPLVLRHAAHRPELPVAPGALP